VAVISFVVCIDLGNSPESNSLLGNSQNCLMSDRECVVENYTDSSVRILTSPLESYVWIQANLVSVFNTYAHEHFEYYINNQNSKSYKYIDPLLKISVTVEVHNGVFTFYTSISSFGKYLISQTTNKVTVDSDKRSQFSLSLLINKISKVVETFVQIKGELYFPCIFSHLYLPNSNTSLYINKDVYIDLVNTKANPRLHFDKIAKHSGKQTLPQLDIPSCVLKKGDCVYEAIAGELSNKEEAVTFRFSSINIKETNIIKITGNTMKKEIAGITFGSIGPEGKRVRKYLEITSYEYVRNNKIDLYGNIVRALIWSNSTTSFLLRGTCQCGIQNNDKARVYIEKDDSVFLLANMDIILCNLTTIKLTGFELGVSVEVGKYYDHSVILITRLSIFSTMILCVVFAVVLCCDIMLWYYVWYLLILK